MNIKKTLGTAVLALSSITATAILPATSVIGSSVAITSLMAISSPAAAGSCATTPTTTTGLRAYGVTEEAEKKATHRALLRWTYDVHKKEGKALSNYDNAQNKSLQCIKEYGIHTICTVTATPCSS